jgi:transposase-like protein
MGHTHLSTPEQRVQWTAMLLAHQGDYGLVTRLSREIGVSRPTLYAWRDQAQQAVLQAFTPPPPAPSVQGELARQILTAWINHASTRGIQTVMRALAHQGVSLATITAVLAEAQQRALTWMQTQPPRTVRALAIDEIYANARRGAYLNVVDVHSGAVWASEGPLPVDTESWTLVLWSLQDRGVRWDRVVGDDGAALQAACGRVTPDLRFQGDHWHVLQSCAHVQARLDRAVRQLETQTTVVARQAARIAAGQRPRGRRPKTDLGAHAQELVAARQVTEAIRYLTQEWRRLLDVVVVDRRGILATAQRADDLAALLRLLAEVAELAPAPQQDDVRRLHTRLTTALPQLLTFVPHVAQVQQDLAAVLSGDQQGVLAWAWLRRQALGWISRDILAAIPSAWRAAARVLLAAWNDAVRVSSAVERWHSILRPHLTVHRTLSTGMLALLAVWHNHRVFRRGVHKGKSPLHLSGMTDAPTDWLVALGYPPVEQALPSAALTDTLVLAA